MERKNSPSYKRFDISKEYEYVEWLKKELNESNAMEIYSLAETHCNSCEKPHHLNPMITCAYKCGFWEVKNKALNIIKKLQKDKNIQP